MTTTVSSDELASRYLEALLKGDRHAALRVALDEGLGQGLSVPELYLRVIQPAQYRIGELWEANRVTVAHEHLATAITQLVMSLAYPELPRAPANGKRVLVSCVDGELHDLGARMTADFFEMGGFDVRYLGADLPLDALVAMVREERADLVVLSVTMNYHLPTAEEAVRRLRETCGEQLRIALGGQACIANPDVPKRLGVDIYGRTIGETLRQAYQAFGLPVALQIE